MSVTRTSSASELDSRVASSKPPKPAPRITTCFFTRYGKITPKQVFSGRTVRLGCRRSANTGLPLGCHRVLPECNGRGANLGERSAAAGLPEAMPGKQLGQATDRPEGD